MKEELKDKIRNYVGSLSNQELLSVILGTENELILKRYESKIQYNLHDANEWNKEHNTPNDYKIRCALELSRRFQPPKRDRPIIKRAEDLIPFLTPWRWAEQEHLLLITLTGAHEIINIHCVTKGILDNCQVHPRELYKHAIYDCAAAVIMAHNHPSGRLEPSKLDISMTQVMKRCGELLGIPLLDHIIVGPEDGYVSIPDE